MKRQDASTTASPDQAARAALEARCNARFEALGIRAQTVHHAPVYTVEAAREVRGAAPDGAVHVKNLFLCDRRKANFYLVTVPEAQRVDLKALADALGERALRFANPRALAEHLGVEAGSVTPLGVIHDTAGAVRLVFDRALRPDVLGDAARIWVHPLHNAATTALSAADLVRFVEDAGHPPLWLALGEDLAS